MAINRFQDKITPSRVGTGSHYTAGTLSGKFKRRGLAGALRNVKGAGRHSYAKNLSNEDLEKFQAVVGKRLAQLSKHSKGFSLKTRRAIMSEFEQMRREGTISIADKQDFKNIVEGLGVNTNRKTTASAPKKPTQRATNFATDDTAQGSNLNTDTRINLSEDKKMSIAGQAANQRRLSRRVKFEVTQDLDEIVVKKPKDTIAKRENLDSQDDDGVVELDIG